MCIILEASEVVGIYRTNIKCVAIFELKLIKME